MNVLTVREGSYLGVKEVIYIELVGRLRCPGHRDVQNVPSVPRIPTSQDTLPNN